MYSREVQDQVLEFGVSGKLMRNVLVMYDRQTDSLWPQLLGRAVEGPMEGAELDFFPSRLTTWGDWKVRHPDTVALVKGYSGRFDPYDSYYASGSAGVVGEAVQDDRLERKEFVLGVVVGETSIAYPYRTLSGDPVVNDVVADRPLLVVFDAETASGIVFDRRVDGQTLTFVASEGLTLEDQETGSQWDGLRGAAVEGELEGTALQQVRSTSAFWFGWKDVYPGTAVYGQ